MRVGARLHCRIAGTSLEPVLPNSVPKGLDGQVNSLGYGKNALDWIIRSQVPKGCKQPMEKVQRLSGSGLCLVGHGLRYSPSHPRGCSEMKGLTSPELGELTACCQWEQTLVAGSLRSFPQDSWSSFQSTRVKRMIRRSGDETSSTHSQTLNRVVVWVA